MKNYVNGYSNPIFKIYNGNTLIDNISLNLTDRNGLTERYEPMSIRHDLLNYSVSTKFLGFHIYFNLSYSEYSDKSNTLRIMKLMNYILNNNSIVIIPRSDVLSRQYNVTYVGKEIDLGLNKGGIKASGNRLINLEFRTKTLQSQLSWLDPNDLTVVLHDFVVVN